MNNFTKKDRLIVACPPYPEYKEQPVEQSHCQLFDCPKCKSKMWLSQRKKGVLLFNSMLRNNIILGCYDCIKELAKKEPGLFAGSETLKI